MRAKTAIASRRTDSLINLRVIEGAINFKADAEVLTLKSATAQVVVIPHTVETDEEAAFLLKEGL
jgi:hypothetical protein